MTRIDRNIWPALSYADAHAARAWLSSLGFEEGTVVPDDGDGIRHSEMLWPEGGRVMISTRAPDREEVGHVQGCYVVTRDPDAVHRRALEIGARVVREPTDTDYGSRDVGLADPEGHRWHFGTYAGEE